MSTYNLKNCHVCNSNKLDRVLFLGYLPPVNGMWDIGTRPEAQPAYPAELLKCSSCSLVQLGTVVDKTVLFPPSYPYVSSTTRVLRENFADLHTDVCEFMRLDDHDLVVDIGSNDGTLLSNFKSHGHPVIGVEPTDAGKIAVKNDIPTINNFFTSQVVTGFFPSKSVKVVTAANVFAHIDDVHEVMENILYLLKDDGVFVSENHYLLPLLQTNQYDTVYHEHLRYYSLQSLKKLFAMHGMEIFKVKKIPSHGGSIRVYAAKTGTYQKRQSVFEAEAEEAELLPTLLVFFEEKVIASKLKLLSILATIKGAGGSISGVGAPSRASTLLTYCGLGEILDRVYEMPNSPKIRKYMPGTLLPVVSEELLTTTNQPNYLLLLSWHIADELMPKLRARGFTGKFIIPLPEPRVVY